MRKKSIIILIIIALGAVSGYYFLTRPNQEIKEYQKTEESKVQETPNPNAPVLSQACVEDNVYFVVGSVSKKENEFLYVKPQKGEEIKIKVTPTTAFIKMIVSPDEKLISQETVKQYDFKEGDSIVTNIFCAKTKPCEYEALFIKIIVHQK
jgi:hypothetical protein